MMKKICAVVAFAAAVSGSTVVARGPINFDDMATVTLYPGENQEASMREAFIVDSLPADVIFRLEHPMVVGYRGGRDLAGNRGLRIDLASGGFMDQLFPQGVEKMKIDLTRVTIKLTPEQLRMLANSTHLAELHVNESSLPSDVEVGAAYKEYEGMEWPAGLVVHVIRDRGVFPLCGHPKIFLNGYLNEGLDLRYLDPQGGPGPYIAFHEPTVQFHTQEQYALTYRTSWPELSICF